MHQLWRLSWAAVGCRLGGGGMGGVAVVTAAGVEGPLTAPTGRGQLGPPFCMYGLCGSGTQYNRSLYPLACSGIVLGPNCTTQHQPIGVCN